VIAISSLHDPRVEAYHQVADPQALAAQGLFVAEGRLVVARLLAASARPGRWAGTAASVLLSPAAFEQMRSVLALHPAVPAYVVPQTLMNGIVGFNIHRGCLALGRRPEVPVLGATVADDVCRMVVLEGVNNPDNIGGIFRSAAAFDADLIALGPACADPLYRKSIRTSMGAALDVPFARAAPWPDALHALRAAGLYVVALTPAADAVPLPRLRLPHRRVALLAGAEGAGLSEPALFAADVRVAVPTTARVDSLNVATALAIALYHVSLT
jgi:tRNA G18 (ribose-2'-O)-methylase SpoU